MMRVFLAILFLAIFSVQALPFKVWGKMLASAQSVEEVQGDPEDGPDDTKAGKFTEDQIVNDHSFDLFASRIGFNNKLTAVIHKAESLPSVHVADILSPPPDC